MTEPLRYRGGPCHGKPAPALHPLSERIDVPGWDPAAGAVRQHRYVVERVGGQPVLLAYTGVVE